MHNCKGCIARDRINKTLSEKLDEVERQLKRFQNAKVLEIQPRETKQTTPERK